MLTFSCWSVLILEYFFVGLRNPSTASSFTIVLCIINIKIIKYFSLVSMVGTVNQRTLTSW